MVGHWSLKGRHCLKRECKLRSTSTKEKYIVAFERRVEIISHRVGTEADPYEFQRFVGATLRETLFKPWLSSKKRKKIDILRAKKNYDLCENENIVFIYKNILRLSPKGSKRPRKRVQAKVDPNEIIKFVVTYENVSARPHEVVQKKVVPYEIYFL